MKVIITGGSGFIGTRLCAFLTGNGHDPIVLSRNPDKTGPRMTGLARAEFWDGKSEDLWYKLIDPDTVVVNLAGANIAAGRWDAAQKERIMNSRVMAGQAVARAVEKADQKPACVVQGSAVGYYGNTGEEVVDESHAPGTDFLAKVASAWEDSTRRIEAMGVRRVVVRTGLVLGNGGAMVKMLPMFKMGLGGVIGSGRQIWPWIHIDDQVEAISFLMENEQASGPFNFTSPTPASNRKFTKTLAKVLGKPAILPLPAFAARLALGEMAQATLLSGQMALPMNLTELGYKFRYSSLEDSLRSIV